MTWNVITNLSKQFTVEGDLSEAIKQMGDNVTTITAVRVSEKEKECCGNCTTWETGTCARDGSITDSDDHCQSHRSA